MNIGECYQILGVSDGATLTEVKSSYRRLARQYHPDVNPGNARSHEQFIQINQAYQSLISWLDKNRQTEVKTPQTSESKTRTQVANQPANFYHHPKLSEFDKLLKQKAYLQLQQLLKYKRFPRAIALVEGLVQRIPQDTEIRQWQAITYQRMGRYLIDVGEFDKANIYLKKAIRTDPLNRSLLSEVKKDLWRLQNFAYKI